MKQDARSATTWILTLGCITCLSACESKPNTRPPSFSLNVRVVLLVETGANVNSPPPETGRCKLTRTQVIDLTQDLMKFQSNTAPGLKLNWDPNDPSQFVILEADCLRIQGFPFPPCFSVCSLTGVPDNCPRKINIGLV